MDETSAASDEASAGRRRHSRLRVNLPVRLITLDGTLHATLLDLSFRGAKVVFACNAPRPGADGVLNWGAFEAFCSVAWASGQACGLDFDTPLRPQMLIATRDLADATPVVDASRVAARAWVNGVVRL